MGKALVELAAHDVEQLQWRPFADGPKGMWVKLLSHDPSTGNHTRLIRTEPGLRIPGVRVHDFWEETYLLDGSWEEHGQVFGRGTFTCYPPGHGHGPYFTSTGWLALEFVYYEK